MANMYHTVMVEVKRFKAVSVRVTMEYRKRRENTVELADVSLY